MGETSLQTAVLTYLNSLPQCMAENVSGNARQSGRADINACYKGKCLKLELKDGDTDYQATEQQKLYLLRWKKAGAIVAVCRYLKDVKKIVKDIDEGKI